MLRHLARAALLLAVLSCARPRVAAAPPLAPSAFPFAVDTVRSRTIAAGVRHHYLYAAAGPWAIHVLDVRLDQCWTPVAVKGGTSAVGRTTTTQLLRTLADTRTVAGGVNADFFLFTPPGVPTNAHVSAGRVLTPPNGRPAFAVDSAGRPHIVVLTRPGTDSIPVDDPRLAAMRLGPFHPLEAVGGRPVLLRDSVPAGDLATAGGASFAAARHPRTAVGISGDGRRLWLVVVDGRQKPYSDGMTLTETATLLRALGAREALNLDGGGSTALVAADPDSAGALRVRNHPSDPTGERAVGNALAIVRREGCRAR
ncbi:MAG: phosphodiester glycosidase family protein [Gemmatimonadaceae bacterium]|nr:phosphodiester glycosidase family protein [Gemmatimonadaceae bacterium]